MNEIYKSIELMRRLTKNNVPFSFSFLSCNTTNKECNGVKTINRAMLRTGFNEEVSPEFSQTLIGYEDLDTQKKGWFHLALLLELNNKVIL